MEFFRPHLKERHGARTQLAAALGVCYGSARKATLRMSLTAPSSRSAHVRDAAARRVIGDIRASCSIMSAGTSVCGQSRTTPKCIEGPVLHLRLPRDAYLEVSKTPSNSEAASLISRCICSRNKVTRFVSRRSR